MANSWGQLAQLCFSELQVTSPIFREDCKPVSFHELPNFTILRGLIPLWNIISAWNSIRTPLHISEPSEQAWGQQDHGPKHPEVCAAVSTSFGRLTEIDAVFGADLFTIVHVRSCKCLQQFRKLAQRIRIGKAQLYVSVDEDRRVRCEHIFWSTHQNWCCFRSWYIYNSPCQKLQMSSTIS